MSESLNDRYSIYSKLSKDFLVSRLLNFIYENMKDVVYDMAAKCHEHNQALLDIEPLRMELKNVLMKYKGSSDGMFAFGTEKFEIGEKIQYCEHVFKYFKEDIIQSVSILLESLAFKYLVDGYNGYNEYLHGIKPTPEYVDKLDLFAAAISDLDLRDFEEWYITDGFDENLKDNEDTHVHYQEIKDALFKVRAYLSQSGFDVQLWGSPLNSDVIHMARERISSLSVTVPERIKPKPMPVEDENELPF